MSEPIVIREFDYLWEDEDETSIGNRWKKKVDENTFAELERLTSASGKSIGGLDHDQMLNIKMLGGKRCVQAQQYVGVIATKSGAQIEILPKITPSNVDSGDTKSISEASEILLRMLLISLNMKYKSSGFAMLREQKTPLLEIFIRMFIDEVMQLMRGGLKSSYVTISENTAAVKGKIQLSRTVMMNYVHRERMFCEFDEFSANIPPNKLIKSTLIFLRSLSKLDSNRTLLTQLCAQLDGIEPSTNIQRDFELSEATGGRRTAGYDTVLRWCDIFLRKGTSFDTFSGHEKAFALLYPMDVLYERYIGQQLKIWVKNQKALDYEVKLQSTSKNLYDDPKAFPLRPDILLYKNGEPILIMDTKWKILNQDKQKHYGISQADMYQMFAYAQRFDQPEVVIIYPQTEEKVEAEYHTRSNSGESDQDAVHVSIRQFNLSYLTELDNKKRHTESEIREKIANELIPKEIREQITKKQIPS